MEDIVQQFLEVSYKQHAYEANKYRDLMIERYQLYGIILSMMGKYNLERYEVSEPNLLEGVSNIKQLKFEPSEDKKTLIVTIEDVVENVSIEE